MFRFLTGALLVGALAVPAQRLDTRAVTVRTQTDSTATLVASWSTSNADSVRVTYSTGVTRTRVAARRVDTLVVPKTAAAQTITVTFTPIRRTSVGAARTASVTIAARVVVEPPPTVDSVRVDTAGSTTPTPTPAPPTTGFGANRPGTGWALVADATLGTLPAGWSVTDWGTGLGAHVPNGVTPFGLGYYESRYPAGTLNCGTGGAALASPTFATKEQFTAFLVWFSPGYRVHTGAEKLWYAGASSGSIVLNGYARSGGLAPIGFRTPGSVFDPQWSVPNGPVIPVGEWVQIEIYQRMNTGAQANGVLKYWVNGRLAIDRADWQFAGNGDAATFTSARVDGTRGGGCDENGALAAEQSRRYHRLAVWTR